MLELVCTPIAVLTILCEDDAVAGDNYSTNVDEWSAPPQSTGTLYVESRFSMFDLIKITSRKTSAKFITFYFRIPPVEQYKKESDCDVVDKLRGTLKTQAQARSTPAPVFAYKRTQYHDVHVSYEFGLENDAKKCIQSVSDLYSKLKESRKEK